VNKVKIKIPETSVNQIHNFLSIFLYQHYKCETLFPKNQKKSVFIRIF